MELTKSYQRMTNITTTYGAIRTYAKYDSQSSTDNTTTYKLQQRYYVNSSYASVSFDSATGTVDGTSKKYTSRTTMPQGETVIQTITRTIVHNADGSSPTKSVSSSWTASFGGGGSGTASITFPDMMRVSQPTLNNQDYNDPLFEIGETVRLYTNRPDATYHHSLYININGTPTLVANNIGEYTDIDTSQFATALYQGYPNNTRILSTFTLYTYDSNNNLLGNASCDYLTYIRNAEPTFDVAYKDTNNAATTITQNNQLIIQSTSTLQFNITNAGIQKYAGGLSSLSITINGETRTDTISGTSGVSKDYNWGTLNLSQNTTASITITDSRGQSTTKTLTIQMLPWEAPTADITLQREQNYYTETNITVDANYTSLDSQNTITITLYKKKTSDANYDAGTTIQNNTQTQFSADNTYSWDIKVVVADRLGSTTYTQVLGKGIPIMFIDRNKRSIGINCLPSGSDDVYISDYPIIESGSNANGTYMKFYNGFMVCMINEMDIPHTSTSTLGGASVHYGSKAWTFPVAFTTPITCIATARDSGSGVFGAEIDGAMGTSSVNITAYGGNTAYKVNAVAFGMWK